jgi:transcriptional regulator with XRE-family HTH domain
MTTAPAPLNLRAVGARLRAARKAHGWTHCKLETLAGVSHNTICRVERGVAK